MINVAEKIDVVKSAEFTGTQMAIDPEFFNKMIWLVIKQYKYKVRTSLQELISNAIDAQVDANNKDVPLKITLPTKLEPTFKLRDYGTGMTPDVVNKIYCNMGASGSSHTNDKKGGFGIGGKSPLGFCDQYNIKTFVNNRYWFYAVYKNENNGINVDLVDSGITDESNGTEIIIPSSHDQIKQFRQGAFRATHFWEVQPIFNTDDVIILEKGLELSDKVTVYEKDKLSKEVLNIEYYNSNLIILVDGIPYQVENNLLGKCDQLHDAMNHFKNGTGVTYAVKNGDLKVLQTRESLEECKLTIDKLNEIGLDISKLIEEYTNGMVKPTLQDTYKAYNEGYNLFCKLPDLSYNKNFSINGNGLTYYTGKKIKSKFTGDIELEIHKFVGVEYHHRSARRYHAKLTNSQRVNHIYLALKLEDIPTFFIDDLPKESEAKKARRCKYLIANLKGEITYIKSEGMPKKLYNKLVKDLGIKLLSSLPMPPKAVKGAAKGVKKLDKGSIDIHILNTKAYNGWNHAEDTTRSIKTIDLNTFEDKVLWSDYRTSSKYLNRTDWTAFWKRRGFSCAYIGKKYQKNIVDDKRFININDYMETFKLSKLEIEGVINSEITCIKGEYRYIKKSGNKLLTNIVTRIIKPYISVKLPKSLHREIKTNNYEEINSRNNKIKYLRKLIKNGYPLISNDCNKALAYMISVDKNKLNRRL